MNESLMFSSKSDEWETPQDLFDKLNEQYHFTLDPCSTEENHKCATYFTQQTNGLLQDWSKEIVFMNLPYGRSIGIWIEKAYKESLKGAVVVCLVPARTDTQWFHKYCTQGKIEFLKGRLKFINRTFPSWNKEGNFKLQSAPFPSMLVYFGLKEEKTQRTLV